MKYTEWFRSGWFYLTQHGESFRLRHFHKVYRSGFTRCLGKRLRKVNNYKNQRPLKYINGLMEIFIHDKYFNNKTDRRSILISKYGSND